MRKYFGVLAALLLLVAPVAAQDVQRVPLAIGWDLDSESSDPDQIVTAVAITDAQTFTIAAQPDACRVVNLTIVDTNMSAGVVTVTGLDCWGDALVCTWTATAGDDTGAVALTYSSGNNSTCTFSSITSITTGTMTGESDETLAAGYTAAPAYLYPIYGTRTDMDGLRYVDPFKSIPRQSVYATTTTLEAADTTGKPWTGAVAGDLVYLTVEGRTYERKLTTVTDDNTAVISSALPSSVGTTDLINVRLKKRFVLADATDAWIPVRGRDSFFVSFDVDANVATGGVTSSIQCSVYENGEFNNITEADTDNVATGATGTNTTSVDLNLAPFTHCRVGAKIGTGDDGDTADEDINIFALIRRRN